MSSFCFQEPLIDSTKGALPLPRASIQLQSRNHSIHLSMTEQTTSPLAVFLPCIPTRPPTQDTQYPPQEPSNHHATHTPSTQTTPKPTHRSLGWTPSTEMAVGSCGKDPDQAFNSPPIETSGSSSGNFAQHSSHRFAVFKHCSGSFLIRKGSCSELHTSRAAERRIIETTQLDSCRPSRGYSNEYGKMIVGF